MREQVGPYLSRLMVPRTKLPAQTRSAEEAHQLGKRLLHGLGVPKNEERAAALFRQAADQGHAGAQFELGECYYYGRGVPKDVPYAISWYRKAAEQKHFDAQNSLRMIEWMQSHSKNRR